MESLERLERLKSLECLESRKSMQSLQSLESLERMQSLESLERLERLSDMSSSLQSLACLERLQSLQSLERLERLEQHDSIIVATSSDYREYVYHDGDVVYCDPPYAGTGGYGREFDHDAFWQWCRTRDFPVYVSEYRAPEDFISIWCKEKRRLFNHRVLSTNAVEHLFLHKKWLE